MRRLRQAIGVLAALSCGGSDNHPPGANDGAELGFEPPVLINAESPVRYPAALFRDRIEGTVVLRLFVDTRGTLVPESTRVAESSGQAALDSAALAAATEMRFAPARRDGRPVATPFLQPIHFQHPSRSGSNQ